METKLTFSLLPVISILISVLAWYVPGFKGWYEKLISEKKQLFMLGVVALVTLVTVGLSALGFLNIYHGPTWREWVWYPIVDFVIAMLANAGAYKATDYVFGKKANG